MAKVVVLLYMSLLIARYRKEYIDYKITKMAYDIWLRKNNAKNSMYLDFVLCYRVFIKQLFRDIYSLPLYIAKQGVTAFYVEDRKTLATRGYVLSERVLKMHRNNKYM